MAKRPEFSIDEQIRIVQEQANMWAQELLIINEDAEKRIAESEQRIRQSKQRLREMANVRYDPKDINREHGHETGWRWSAALSGDPMNSTLPSATSSGTRTSTNISS